MIRNLCEGFELPMVYCSKMAYTGIALSPGPFSSPLKWAWEQGDAKAPRRWVESIIYAKRMCPLFSPGLLYLSHAQFKTVGRWRSKLGGIFWDIPMHPRNKSRQNKLSLMLCLHLISGLYQSGLIFSAFELISRALLQHVVSMCTYKR